MRTQLFQGALFDKFDNQIQRPQTIFILHGKTYSGPL